MNKTTNEEALLGDLLSSLRQARQSHAGLLSQAHAAEADLARQGAELAQKKYEVERRYRQAAEAGEFPNSDFPEESDVAKLERHNRTLQARVSICSERVAASQAAIDDLQTRAAIAWRDFGVSQFQQLTRKISETALELQGLASQYHALTCALEPLLMPQVVPVSQSAQGRILRTSRERWALIGGAPEVYENLAGSTSRNAPVPHRPIETWTMALTDVLPEQSTDVPVLLVAGLGKNLRICIDDSFFGGGDWKAMGDAGCLYERLSQLRTEVGAVRRRSTPRSQEG
jgi:hypothetical protein